MIDASTAQSLLRVQVVTQVRQGWRGGVTMLPNRAGIFPSSLPLAGIADSPAESEGDK